MVAASDQPSVVLGIDVGGTFTDVLAFDASKGTVVAALKIPSTPSNPALAAVLGIDRFRDRNQRSVSGVFHGTTVGTNTLIERRGGRTALVATKGFKDVLDLRRQARPRLYDLKPVVSPALVQRELRIEAAERMTFDGTIECVLSGDEIARITVLLKELGIESVAISLLHSYANDDHERQLGSAIRHALPNVFLTLSSDVSREFREFERTSTTVVNAYIGPAVSRYFDHLKNDLRDRSIGSLFIVKSNGGLTSVANARNYPVHLIESGPAAGVIAAAALGRSEKIGNLIAFDMGGTTSKVGVVRNHEPRLSTEFYADQFVDGRDVGGYPIISPMIDIIEIGAGGGSIAHIDAAGVIKVGPKSAGADPGPACYCRGGELPTVTDAHVALGHIAADGFGSEDLKIDADRASRAIATHLGQPLNWTVPKAAWGILHLANANMAEMVRLATLRRGLDPRDFVLVAFGGAGPLHAAEIAREVGIPKVLIPPLPGLFSAIGTVLGDIRHDLVQTVLRRTTEVESAQLTAAYAAIRQRLDKLIASETTDSGTSWTFERYADLRFERQLFEITLPVPDGVTSGPVLEKAFREAYAKSYGYDLTGNNVEIVNARMVAKAVIWRGAWPRSDGLFKNGLQSSRLRTILASDGKRQDVPVFQRSALALNSSHKGPMIIEDFGATIRVLSGQNVLVNERGILEITE